MTGWEADARCADPAVIAELHAAGRTMDSVMFPGPGAGATSRDARIAAHADGKRVCRGCPVIVACLDAALAQEGGAGSGRWGVRGGLAPDERATLYRTRNRS